MRILYDMRWHYATKGYTRTRSRCYHFDWVLIFKYAEHTRTNATVYCIYSRKELEKKTRWSRKACTHLALNDNYASLAINADSTRVLQNVSAEFPQELSILIVHLDLVRWRPFSNHEITSHFVYCHSISQIMGVLGELIFEKIYKKTLWRAKLPVRIKQLAVTFTAFTELELEAPFFVKDL